MSERHTFQSIPTKILLPIDFSPSSQAAFETAADLAEHDFLWRSTCRLPKRGRIGIFNRFYYEAVLVFRVHPKQRSTGNAEQSEV